jgi:predicted RNA-binding protein Jag
MRYVLVDGVEIKVFDTLDGISCSIEPPEVASGVFKVFDDTGYKYRIEVESSLSNGFFGIFKTEMEAVKITKDTHSTVTIAELRSCLEEYLNIISTSYSEYMSIDELINLTS